MRNARILRLLCLAPALLSALAVAGCVSDGGPNGVGAGSGILAGSMNYHFGGAPGSCTQAIGQFRGVVDADAASGNLNRNVHAKVIADLDAPQANCAAGRDANATRLLAAVKARYGYR